MRRKEFRFVHNCKLQCFGKSLSGNTIKPFWQEIRLVKRNSIIYVNQKKFRVTFCVSVCAYMHFYFLTCTTSTSTKPQCTALKSEKSAILGCCNVFGSKAFFEIVSKRAALKGPVKWRKSFKNCFILTFEEIV